MTATKTAAGNLWTLVPTPDPAEVGLCVFIDRANVRLRDIPAIGSAYSSWTRCWPELTAQGFGTWAYMGMQAPASPAETTAFFWVRRRTQSQRDTPFNTFDTAQAYSWPAVLLGLQFVFDQEFPLFGRKVTSSGKVASVTAAQVYERKRLLLPADGNHRMTVQEFLSDVPWPSSAMQHAQPLEGLVEWDFNGARDSIRCLHDDIEVPARGKPYAVALDGVASGSSAPPEPDRVFPATNFKRWRAFVFSDEQKWDTTGWYRRKCILHPPAYSRVVED